jgi:hypothetical protein
MNYTVGLLPLRETGDFTLPIRVYRPAWVESLRIVDEIRIGPLEIDIQLRTLLDSCRQHLAVGLALIDSHLRGRRESRFGLEDPAALVQGLKNCYELFLTALLQAKAAWNSWLDGTPLMFGMGDDGTVVPTTSVPGVTAPSAVEQMPAATEAAVNAAAYTAEAAKMMPKPKSVPDLLLYIGMGLAAAAVIGFFRKS